MMPAVRRSSFHPMQRIMFSAPLPTSMASTCEYVEIELKRPVDLPQFERLFREYHDVDHEVRRIEEGVETPSDEYTEDQKKKRLKLKDELYAMIVNPEIG